jgi:hypothetical protein
VYNQLAQFSRESVCLQFARGKPALSIGKIRIVNELKFPDLQFLKEITAEEYATTFHSLADNGKPCRN